jgi:hypothetical protein
MAPSHDTFDLPPSTAACGLFILQSYRPWRACTVARRARFAGVQCPHEANPREHRRALRRGDQDQGFHGGLPLCGLVLGLRKLRDVPILKGDEIATARQRYWIIKGPFPATLSHWRASLAASSHLSAHGGCDEKYRRLDRGWRVLPRRFVHVRFGHADGLRWWLGRGPTQWSSWKLTLRRAASSRLEMIQNHHRQRS